MVNFKTLLDKATSSDLKETDWESILEIVEEVKTKSVAAKTAMKELRKKLQDTDGNCVYYTLLVMDSIMKNCGPDVHKEVLSQDFLSVIKGIIKTSQTRTNEKAIDKALELVGEWKSAFGSQSEYKAIQDVFSELKTEGFHIPEPQVASAAFVQKPPDWKSTDSCAICHTDLKLLRRHHCRNCGNRVCNKCSEKRAPLPDFGITEKTRVCDLCFKKLDKGASQASGTSEQGKASSSTTTNSSDLPAEYLQSALAREPQVPAAQSNDKQREIQEQDDIQIAIAMSLNEQENKKGASKTSGSASEQNIRLPSAPPTAPPASSPLYATISHSIAHDGATEERPGSDDPLARYLDRSYWEQRRVQQGPTASATPAGVVQDSAPMMQATAAPEVQGTSSLAETVRKTTEQFVQRLQQVSAAGGSVATDQVVLMLYQNLNAMQPQLLKEVDDVQQKKAAQEKLLHKVIQAKEARVSLNAMRRMHLERIRQQEQEQSILARMQMEQKLALLRQQKAEQMAYQETLRQERMVKLSTQQQEFEFQIQEQRERERLQLIAQEQQVLHSHFGGLQPPQDDRVVGAYGGGLGNQMPMMPPGGHYQMPSTITLQEVQQLPTKVEPELYHPPPYTASSESLYQPLLQQHQQPPQPAYHPPLPLQTTLMPHGPPLSMGPTHSLQASVPQLTTYHPIQPAPVMYSSSPSVSMQQPPGLSMQSMPYAAYSQPPPTSVQRQESEPPLIVL